MNIQDLQGEPCTLEELEILDLWVKTRVGWRARILQAIGRPDGYLLEIFTPQSPSPQWYGISFDDFKLTQGQSSPSLL